jgi:trehalose synthase
MPTTLKHVRVAPLDPQRFTEILSDDQSAGLANTITRACSSLGGRVVWNINSTMRGGGVAEMLASLVAYSRGAGIDARWSVIRGDDAFFKVTKRLHNKLHGEPGDGGPLGEDERGLYVRLCEERAARLAELVRPEDIVLLHDPQTAGMVSRVKQTGATVIWRAHIGVDLPNELAREAWDFLLPFVEPADAYVFSREAFAWTGLDPDKLSVIPPSIDAFSPKNQPMDDGTVTAVLRCGGIEAGPCLRRPRFTRLDGTPARVDARADLVGDPLPTGTPVLLQVSRWDRLKDHAGVVRAFSEEIASRTAAHLILAGPDVKAVADDPEGAEVLQELIAMREGSPPAVRERVHLASLPMRDPEENAAFVNALQRRATVIAQKSLREGFGLTVTEAMWKAKPVVAGRVGGIQDQVPDADCGMLVDPTDLSAFSEAVIGLFEHPSRAVAMGQRAQEHVRASFLGPRQLGQYVELFERLLTTAGSQAA